MNGLLITIMIHQYSTANRNFFVLLTVFAHMAHNILILQWNKIRKNLNIYSFTMGISGILFEINYSINN